MWRTAGLNLFDQNESLELLIKSARFAEKSQEGPFPYCTDGKTEAKNRPVLDHCDPPRSLRTAPLEPRGSSTLGSGSVAAGVVSASGSVSLV